MKKQSLKLYEILNLEVEINGFIDPSTGKILMEGLLNQAISYGVKLNIKLALKNIEIIKKEVLNIQDELIAKYGDIDADGNTGINRVIFDEKRENPQPNPKYFEYQKEWNDFLNNNEREIEFPLIQVDELKNIRTKDTYKTIDQYFLS